MTTETSPTETKNKNANRSAGASEAVYGLGMIGAWIYFLGHATSFWIGVLGFLKGIVWPAILVYEALLKLGL